MIYICRRRRSKFLLDCLFAFIINEIYYTSILQKNSILDSHNLIKNADRGQSKPNLLFSNAKNQAYLIDHEFILNRNEIQNVNFNNFSFEPKYTKYHLCYKYLKSKNKQEKEQYFNEFQEYLNHLDIHKLYPYFKSLQTMGFATSEAIILHWLTQLKQNSATFVNNLRGAL